MALPPLPNGKHLTVLYDNANLLTCSMVEHAMKIALDRREKTKKRSNPKGN
jgi:hypothetical protein